MIQLRSSSKHGRGAFTDQPICKGELVVVCEGTVLRTEDVPPDCLAMQIADDLWLCSDGDQLDDGFNHSCDPNVGFITGEPTLYALRHICPGEELCWDYSTSLTERGWTLECLCHSPRCRGTVRSFGELSPEQQAQLLPISLRYIRRQFAR